MRRAKIDSHYKRKTVLDFKRLELKDIELLRPFYEMSGDRSCDNTIGGTFIWRDYFQTEYVIDSGVLYSKSMIPDGGVVFSTPMRCQDSDGAQNAELAPCYVETAVDLLREYCANEHIPLKIGFASEMCKDYISKHFDVKSIVASEWFDYLYKAEDMVGLEGRKYSGQRNHINYFLRTYSDNGISDIAHEDVSEVKVFFEEYNSDNPKESETFAAEKGKVHEVLDHFEAYGMSGIVLRVSKRIVAFSIGEVVGDTLFVHIEKANRDYRGAYPYILQQFVTTNMPSGIAYVNLEDDAGDPGLRQFKMSYHPTDFIKKYEIEIVL